jgi:hypothetical protein
MNTKGNNVLYYQKCNHCQHSEYEKPLKEAPWQEPGIHSFGEYECSECGKKSKVELKFFK